MIACAGAGKSTILVNHAMGHAKEGRKVLLVTYTISNQQELSKKIHAENKGVMPDEIIIKGWFSFLLEDLIRPYQACIFPERIPAINFNDADPHMRNGRNIPGTAEKLGGALNPRHFLTKATRKAHTTYLSKLAFRICKESAGKPIARLLEIYKAIYFDEVQDFVGWDYDLFKLLAKSKLPEFRCVGDFRQTLYSTATARKAPLKAAEKQAEFASLGFSTSPLYRSRRCIQAVCSFADLVHANENIYQPTESIVQDLPADGQDHLGIFTVKPADAKAYLAKYDPVILRLGRNTRPDLCEGKRAHNFGEAKGMGFDRVFIVTTEPYAKFLAGDRTDIDDGKTDRSKNALYVAITRARYSVAFLYDGALKQPGISSWLLPQGEEH